jgi:hypothetical protein
MRISPDVPAAAVSRSRETDEFAALKAAHWRDRDANRALVDTVVAYRTAANALAEENLELRHELARARALSTRRTTSGADELFELTIACDEFAAEIVAIAVGEALDGTQTANAVEAWQLIAFEMANETIRTHAHSSEAMIMVRMKHSPHAVGVEVSALESAEHGVRN